MKKGFTLVELIAVVAILGIIAIIAGVSYTTINNNHKKTSCKNLKKQLENAAIECVQDNMCQNNSVSYQNLIDNGYMEEDLKNPVDDSVIPKNFTISVAIDVDDNYSASSSLSCGD